ncbi:MAG: di-heme oxidoredictase family protein [Gemmatimonadota bacterium]
MRRVLYFFPLATGLSLAACSPSDKTGSALTDPVAGGDTAAVMTAAPGQPVFGLSPRERQLFNRGMAVFATPFTEATGLGPLFNSNSCAACHDDPALGGYGDSSEVHVAAYHPGQSCNTLGPTGGPVVQQHATPLLEALGILKEPTPAGATATAFRTTPLIFGLGLLDAVGDRTIRALARVRYPDGVHGRAAILANGHVGRFGRKASVASLTEFNAGAFFNEMGVTNRFNPFEGTIAGTPFQPGIDPAPEPEVDAASLAAADAFVRFLSPVAPVAATPESRLGGQLFVQIGCANCHLPVLQTDFNSVRALSRQRIRAYTDLLLHDMGPAEADICNGVARPEEFRTQPLMGMQFLDMFMHDGLASTIPEAIQRHGGEGSAARDRFATLSPADQTALATFVGGL